MQAVTTDPLAALADLPGVFEAVDAARASIDGLLREPRCDGPGRGEGAVSSSSGMGLSHVGWSQDLPGRTSTRRSGRTTGLDQRCGPAVGRRGSDLADTWRRAPLQALARLHTLAAVDVSETEALGRPRPRPWRFRPVGGRSRKSVTRTKHPESSSRE